MGNDMCGGDRGETKKKTINKTEFFKDIQAAMAKPNEAAWLIDTRAYIVAHTDRAKKLAMDRVDAAAIQEFQNVIDRITVDLTTHAVSTKNKKELMQHKFRSIGNIAGQYDEQAKLKTAVKYYEEAYEIAVDPMFQSDADTSNVQFLSILSSKIAYSYWNLGQPIKSLEYFKAAEKYYTTLEQSNPSDLKEIGEKLDVCKKMQIDCVSYIGN